MTLSRDSMGDVEIAIDALWGASTQRAILNFPISGHRLPAAFIRALALVKLAAANANAELAGLSPEKCRLIGAVAREIMTDDHAGQFPVDVFQTGSGTSTNTNINEVIAQRALQLSGGTTVKLHPNDDVNRSQSSNDVIPTALHVSVSLSLQRQLRPALIELAEALERKTIEFSSIVKVGRTHLMDALPMTLGQEFSGYARQIRKAITRVDHATHALRELAIGGTAVGTGLNAPRGFAARVCAELSVETNLKFREATNHYEAQGARDDCVEVAGVLTTVAGSLTKIANDLRLLGSGPHGGLAELHLPPRQPGSSIMPGKVNPVLCEMLVQVGLYVHGLMHTVNGCGRDGQLELNATLPLIAYCLHEAVTCLANGTHVFARDCVVELTAAAEHCAELVERSLMQVTVLTPALGYDVAAAVAHEALETGRSLREIVLARGLLPASTLARLLDAVRMTHGGRWVPSPTNAEMHWENEGGKVRAGDDEMIERENTVVRPGK